MQNKMPKDYQDIVKALKLVAKLPQPNAPKGFVTDIAVMSITGHMAHYFYDERKMNDSASRAVMRN